MTDKTPAFKDAKNNTVTIQNWNTGYRTYYAVLLKVSSEGVIEWNKYIEIDNSPKPPLLITQKVHQTAFTLMLPPPTRTGTSI